MRTAHIIACISHGINDATNGGAVLSSYLPFLKKIRIIYFLPLLVIFTLCFFLLPTAFAATVTIAWDKNSETDVIGYNFHYGTFSKNYKYTVDVKNNTSCTISGLVEGTQYYFAVTAYNDKNLESDYSEELVYTIPIIPPPSLQYELIVETDGEGSVQLDPPGLTYNEGTVVEITAVADPGSAFDSWSGDITSSNNPITITMDADITVIANFVPSLVPQFTLTAITDGNGSVLLNPPGPTYNEGTVVEMTAVADPGSAFDSWSGDITGSANPITITMDADINVTAGFTESATIYSETFDTYTTASDPVDWIDTAANNSMAENDTLFEIFDLNGNKVFGTTSTQTNIHSHHTGAGIDALSGYEYSGRMMMTSSNGDIGITFFSQYPNTDTYYRLRKYGTDAFHIAPHPHGTQVGGDTDTGVFPSPNVWYWFRILVEDTGSHTEIRAKVWPENSVEPAEWQLDCYDSSASRLKAGTIGVWSMGSGSKYWDNLTVTQLGPLPLQYELTMNTVGNGSVKLDPPGGTYDGGTVVQLTATAAAGWEFSGWSGDITGSTNPVTITMGADKTVTANFELVPVPQFNLTVNTIGNGSVKLDPPGGTYDGGTVVQLTATAAAGWEFSGWSGDITGSTNPVTITMGADKTVTANFELVPVPQFNLTVNTIGNGSVKLDPPGGTYDGGTVVQLTATAAAGWEFSGWSGDITGSTNPVTITMGADKTVTANFELVPVPQFNLTVNTIGNGSVKLDPPGGTYDGGTVVQLTATAAAGWEFSGWSGDITGSTNPVTITMGADKTVTANFELVPVPQFNLTVNTIGNGSVKLDPPGGTYDGGTVVQLTATAAAGWEFSGWSGDITGSTNPTTLTITSDHQVTIKFANSTKAYSEIIGTWSSGIWFWDNAESKWTKMTSDIPDGAIAAGDITGDGKTDVAGIFDGGLWYQDGATFDRIKVSGTPPNDVTAGDVTGDGRSEIIGTWSSGIWFWDDAESKWTKMTSNIPDGEIAAGDFTGDGKADVASCWKSGLWYQDGATLDWIKISGRVPDRLTAADVTGDGRSEIIGTWKSGIWHYDLAASKWTKMTSNIPDGEIAAGDFTGDGKADVASCWKSGLWYQDGATLDWTNVSNSAPDRLTAADITEK